MIERIIDAEYTAEKQEGTFPPCENSVVTVTGTYTYEFTLEDGDSLSDIDTTDLTEGSIAIDGDNTYEWDGTQWALVCGEPKFRKITVTNNRTGSNTTIQIASCLIQNGKIGSKAIQIKSGETKDVFVPIPWNVGNMIYDDIICLRLNPNNTNITFAENYYTVKTSYTDVLVWTIVKINKQIPEDITMTIS